MKQMWIDMFKDMGWLAVIPFAILSPLCLIMLWNKE